MLEWFLFRSANESAKLRQELEKQRAEQERQKRLACLQPRCPHCGGALPSGLTPYARCMHCGGALSQSRGKSSEPTAAEMREWGLSEEHIREEISLRSPPTAAERDAAVEDLKRRFGKR